MRRGPARSHMLVLVCDLFILTILQYADRFAERAVTATAGGSANAAASLGVADNGPAPSVDDVGQALDWWAARAAQTDAEVHRLELEERRYA